MTRSLVNHRVAASRTCRAAANWLATRAAAAAAGSGVVGGVLVVGGASVGAAGVPNVAVADFAVVMTPIVPIGTSPGRSDAAPFLLQGR